MIQHIIGTISIWAIPAFLVVIPLYGAVKGVNNDHGISPDGKQLAISAGQMYVLPFAGGEPRQVTQKSPSYFHGWSPDGRSQHKSHAAP